MSAAGYDSLLLGAPLIVLGIAVLYLLRWRLNILLLSDDEARASGMNVKAMRIVTVLCATGITASCVSMCGQVGWWGFWCLTCAACATAATTWRWFRRRCAWGPPSWWRWDTMARSVSAAELPLSILTAIIGAPFFIVLMRRSGGWQM